MLDVRLITVIPAQPNIAAPGTPQAVTTQAGAPTLPQLPNGTILSGFIVNRDASGNPILRTETGDVVFSTNFFLKIGSEVVLRLQNAGGKQTAHLISVNGQPPEIAEGQSAFSDEPDIIIGGRPAVSSQQSQNTPAAQQASATPTAQNLPRIGQTIPAIVVTPNFIPSQPATVAPGSSLLLSVLGFSLPDTKPVSNNALTQITAGTIPAGATPPTPNSALASLIPGTAPAATTSSAQPAIPGQPLPASIPGAPQAAANYSPAGVLPDTPPAAAAPSALTNQQAAKSDIAAPLGQSFLATVIQKQPDGSVTLQSPIGVLRIADLPNLPVGQPLAVRVSSVAAPNGYTLSVASNTSPSPPAPLTELARHWVSLAQITGLLQAENVGELIIPSFPGAAAPNSGAGITQAASQIMFFISALKGGDFRTWFGNAPLRALEEKGYGSLIKKAEAEFSLIARQFADVQPGNWQTTFIPILAGQELQQLRAFIKREKKKDESGRPTNDEDTRFVLEMDLSQLGEMQMDGLVKRRDAKLQFDLVIRSHHPLPVLLQKDIREIYASTSELTGYQGQLTFSDNMDFPVHPMMDVAGDIDDVIA